MDCLQIQNQISEDDPDFQFYEGIISSTKLNSKYFKWSDETLASINRQANEGTSVYPLHDTYREFPIGKSTSSRIQDDQVLSKFGIQKDLRMGSNNNTDDLIARMNTGVVDGLSTGTIGGNFLCDVDGTKFEYKSDGLFFYTRRCQEGHRLGETVRVNKKDVTVTATVYGEVNLYEFSVVGSGAVPDAKVIRKLQEMLDSNELEENDLLYITELNGFSLPSVCDSLGVSPSFDKPAIVTPEPYKIQNTPKPKGDDMSLELVTQERDRLSARVETLEAEIQEKDEKLAKYEEEGKDREELEQELNAKSAELLEKEQELEESKAMAEQGKAAINKVHKLYKAASISEADAYGTPLTDEQLQELDTSLLLNKDFLGLYNSTEQMLRRARKARSEGRQSKPTDATDDKTSNLSDAVKKHVAKLNRI